MSQSFADWPPSFTFERLSHLSQLATTYALAHGLLYLPPTSSPSVNLPHTPSSAIHAPLSLVPSPFPRALFTSAQRLQHLYNVLYARIALDYAFLDRVMGAEEGVGAVDTFTGTLWRGWKALRDDGVDTQLHLGLFRSDYLLHQNEESRELELKQVEFNTISSSFGTLSERAAGMHRYIAQATLYFNSSSLIADASHLPPNETTSNLAVGLAEAHAAYLSLYHTPSTLTSASASDTSGTSTMSPRVHVLFVVQPNERNVFDQRWLEYALLSHGIPVVRQTLAELTSSASLSSNGTLQISLPTLSSTAIEISTIYFRATYTPTDFAPPTTVSTSTGPTLTSEALYKTRFLLERSRAICCPSLPLQLSGGKKVQQILARPGVLERFTQDWTDRERAEVRGSWMDMWGLDDREGEEALDADGLPPVLTTASNDISKNEPHGTTRARTEHSRLVLKPQREGGGNNVYKEAIPSFLDTLSAEERKAWIAMRLIDVPERGGLLLRAGAATASPAKEVNSDEPQVQSEAPRRTGVVSELGVFGWALFGPGLVKLTEDPSLGAQKNGRQSKDVREREAGWLLRTKGVESDEGGVAAGFSVLDSVVLID